MWLQVAGIQLNASVKVVSNTVSDGIRTTVMTRPLAGLTPHHHTFNAKQMSLDFISALGSSPTFSYHSSKTTATIAMWPSHSTAAADPTTAGGKFGFFQNTPVTGRTCPALPCKFRNDFAGEVGYEIVTKAQPVHVTALGRSGAHLKAGAMISIWDAATKKVIASAEVGPAVAGATTSGYTYVDLATPVTLKANTKYLVTQACTPGMPDVWSDTNANLHGELSAYATVGNGVFSHTDACPTASSTPGRWAGIGTFKIAVPPHPAPKQGSLPYSCVCSIPAAPFGHGKGTLKYLETGETIGFPPRCNLGSGGPANGTEGEDYSVMKNKNPTCDIRTYVGGLSTCHHG